MSLLRVFSFSVIFLAGCGKEPEKPAYIAVDGDTIKIVHSGGNTDLKELAFIDAPEIEQPYGREAKKYLADILRDEHLVLKELDGQFVELFISGRSINTELITEGVAWVSPKNKVATENGKLVTFQNRAANTRKGLWGLEHGLRVPPWQWRANARDISYQIEYERRLRQKKEQYKRIQKTPQSSQYDKLMQEEKLQKKQSKEGSQR